MMRIAKQSTFGNTAVAGNVTYRLALTYLGVIVVGGVLFLSPVFRWNWPAMAAYGFLASIIVGQTPTQRALVTNIYGILFKKPKAMVITELATTTSMGHGVREVVREDDMETMAFKLGTGNYALVYHITSDINRWSSEEDYLRQATNVKNMFNVFEGGESFFIITKEDSDTGMLKLEEYLTESDVILGDDYQAMSDKRKEFLRLVATLDASKSVQQYGVLVIKPKNIKRTTAALHRSARVIRPAAHPGNVVLAAIGLEGGGVEFVRGDD